MFDVFLAHNSQDKPLIRTIYHKLQSYGLKPWLDEEHIPAGTIFQDEIQLAITQVKTSAIFLGNSGLGRWQVFELRTFISQCVERGIPIIPVLLPGVSQIPENLLFLREFNAVIFKDSVEDAQAIAKLYRGITGKELEIKVEKPFDPSSVEDNLLSERAVDYRKLRDLLKAGKWEEADKETIRRLSECCSGKKELLGLVTSIHVNQLRNIPCADLQTIDRLWLKYSLAQFGFSIQRKIYLQCHRKMPDHKNLNRSWDDEFKFQNKVGWKDGTSWRTPFQFANQVPLGNLPCLTSLYVRAQAPRRPSDEYSDDYRRNHGYIEIFLRLEDCKPWYLDII
jgi:hypothetical protein